ncbi:cytochrome c biogenesis protein ResB [Caldimonas brevitalea]|uniref:Cytochrome c biogenesis protein n=1 Tax=Caldimonas brevitalea TaxID=413882 RepID=A0A0G3BKR8_9BURK|nr:cytochrome c biogenesis protein ResB [Caldimonas brevitalea]AKJ28583.1 cytochrome c biogenesis protein [Caldimonas brevitalea]
MALNTFEVSPQAMPAGRKAALLELLSSMRFAISLLVVICIAAGIGSVVPQGQPGQRYVDQFGLFWSALFGRLDIYAVYSAWWFLMILGFLVLSTSLCVARNLPRILVDVRTFKEQVREQSLAAHRHKATGWRAEDPQTALARVTQRLHDGGWRYRLDVRENGVMVAAKQGAMQRLGYLLTHSSIVLICLGGLVDGDLLVRLQMWAQGVVPTQGGAGALSPAHRMGLNTPAFRANLRVTEGERASLAVINLPQGMVMQPLPFDVALKRFKVEYYDTGMPRLFASDIVIHDPQSGAEVPATVEVNRPFIYRGVAIYQSSFADGGSRLTLRAWPLDARMGLPADGKGWELHGAVHAHLNLPEAFSRNGLPVSLELTDLRVINVQDMGTADGGSDDADAAGVSVAARIEQHLGAGDKGAKPQQLRNVGPSVSYKLRDASGQAREYQNYMLPVEVDGQRVFLFGQRRDAGDTFRYLRVPADEDGSLQGWMRLRWALADPELRTRAAQRHAARATGGDPPESLVNSAAGALALFAGAAPGLPQDTAFAGFQALTEVVTRQVDPAEQTQAAELLLRLVDGTLFELNNLARERHGLAALAPNDAAGRRFLTQAALSLSDSFLYGAPAIFALDDFEHVQASVFQVARAPGTTLVYLGSALLVAGVFAMLYIRERRLWVWLQPATAESGSAGTRLACAMSANRRTLDLEREFEQLSTFLLAAPAPARASHPLPCQETT